MYIMYFYIYSCFVVIAGVFRVTSCNPLRPLVVLCLPLPQGDTKGITKVHKGLFQ